MGTRADFYVGRGKGAEWLGSIAWDGYPSGLKDSALFTPTCEDMFRSAVKSFLASRDDATYPEDGWPWPWDDSRTTDYAYAFDGGEVHGACFGEAWFDPRKAAKGNGDEDHTGPGAVEGAKATEFPDMSARKAVTLGKRSGLIVFGG